MKDIEKMKKDFEQQIIFAEKENALCEKVGEDIDLKVIGESFTEKGKIHVHCYHVKTMKQIGQLLSVFPVTEPKKIRRSKGGDLELSYRMQLHKRPNSFKTELSVSWISDDIDISFDYDINGDEEELMQYLKQTTRKLTEIEISSYGIQKTRYNYNYREMFPYLTFSCGSVLKYQGGYDVQTSEGHVLSMVETLKYLYEYAS